jgi:hypothetical protein
LAGVNPAVSKRKHGFFVGLEGYANKEALCGLNLLKKAKGIRAVKQKAKVMRDKFDALLLLKLSCFTSEPLLRTYLLKIKKEKFL